MVGVGADCAQVHVAGIDSDRNVKAQALHRFADAQRGQNRSFGVILVGDRRAEERQHRIAEQPVDAPVEGQDGVDHRLQHVVDSHRGVLRCQIARASDRAGQVGEEDRQHTVLAVGVGQELFAQGCRHGALHGRELRL